MICLSLAIASVGRAMQRQSDNRHHLIAQAMAFMMHYRNLRGSNYETLSEVEYNFGRVFHQLGLYSQAAKHYESVFLLAEKELVKVYSIVLLASFLNYVQEVKCDSDCTQEAAYNLAMIYTITGATGLAESIYSNWLSF